MDEILRFVCWLFSITGIAPALGAYLGVPSVRPPETLAAQLVGYIRQHFLPVGMG
jgi:hypothetical protein